MSAMRVCCDSSGRPRTRLHGLRMLNPELFSRLPLSSADSTNVSRNVQLDRKWIGPYVPSSKRVRGLVLVDRIESHNALPSWSEQSCLTFLYWVFLNFATLCNIVQHHLPLRS